MPDYAAVSHVYSAKTKRRLNFDSLREQLVGVEDLSIFEMSSDALLEKETELMNQLTQVREALNHIQTSSVSVERAKRNGSIADLDAPFSDGEGGIAMASLNPAFQPQPNA